MATKTWQEVAEDKRRALLDSIPAIWRIPDERKPLESQANIISWLENSGWFTSKELEITGKTATELLPKLHRKEWSCQEVTEAFCKRASAAHQLTNCLSETFFDRAKTKAIELDMYLAAHNSLKGPLHGLPISIKDNFNVVGVDSTIGYVQYVNDPAKQNSPLVDILEELGAVLYVKTNVPTAMMIAESVNNCFGRTVNPLNRNLTSGGSSGGESALIASGGSCLGVGSDIGGSLRIPASCTGLYTLRPSSARFPTLATRSGLAGQEAVASVNGPLARCLADLALYSRAVIGARPWLLDPKCVPIPWRGGSDGTVGRGESGGSALGETLKIAVLWDDGVVTPTPPVHRALVDFVERVKRAGHQVEEWEATDHAELTDILAAFFTADGGKSIEKDRAKYNEPWRPEMKAYEIARDMSVHELWQIQIRRTELAKAYLDRWNKAGIDALVLPTTPFTAPKNGEFEYVGYTGVFNILDYSAISFPSGLQADRELDAEYNYEPAKSYTDIDQRIRNKYSSEDIHGMPINLQLVARKLEEEKLINMLEIIENKISQNG